MRAKEFWDKHKKTITIVAGGTGVIIIVGLLYHYRQPLIALCKKGIRVKSTPQNIARAKAITEKIVDIESSQMPQLPLAGKEPFSVCGHVRRLPEGHQASHEKIRQIIEMGLDPEVGLTYVNPYIKNAA